MVTVSLCSSHTGIAMALFTPKLIIRSYSVGSRGESVGEREGKESFFSKLEALVILGSCRNSIKETVSYRYSLCMQT